jgi:hypothetical protein
MKFHTSSLLSLTANGLEQARATETGVEPLNGLSLQSETGYAPTTLNETAAMSRHAFKQHGCRRTKGPSLVHAGLCRHPRSLAVLPQIQSLPLGHRGWRQHSFQEVFSSSRLERGTNTLYLMHLVLQVLWRQFAKYSYHCI